MNGGFSTGGTPGGLGENGGVINRRGIISEGVQLVGGQVQVDLLGGIN